MKKINKIVVVREPRFCFRPVEESETEGEGRGGGRGNEGGREGESDVCFRDKNLLTLACDHLPSLPPL